MKTYLPFTPSPRSVLSATVASAILYFTPQVSAVVGTPTQAAASSQATTTSPDWTFPKNLETKDYDVVKFQPQIDEWKDNKLLKARMAVSIQKKNSDDDPKYVSIEFEANTTVNPQTGMVDIGPRRTIKLLFVDAQDANEKARLKKILTEVQDDQRTMHVSLATLNAAIEQSNIANRDINVNYDPPPIFYSETPSVLVAFMGEPDFKAVDPKKNKILFALNTNWDILMDVGTSTYYLLINDGWVKTTDLKKGPWELVDSLPASFSDLPDDDNWSNVKKALNAEAFELLPQVFVSYQPAELIETTGAPELTPISGTKLLYVKNTDSDVFFLTTDSNYYYLVEGRWFRSKQMTGEWSAATLDLPKEFAKIPRDHAKADVLVSVPDTDSAEEAAIVANIPKTATVKRSDAKLTVEYDGDPQFEPIKGSTNVQYAVNTQNDVFLSGNRYYSCYQGIWFEGPTATGPWDVCDRVDPNIYTIPASAPQHNVTYVQVYNSTPDVVQVGYTSGYTGQYLARGLLVFGAGYWLGSINNHHHRYHGYHWYRPSYIGWGCGARYSWGYGGYYRPSYWGYGPHGGICRPVPYYHGRYHRPYYAHYRPGYHRPAYNPWYRPGHRPRPIQPIHRPGYRPGHRPGYRPVIEHPIPYAHWKNNAVRIDDRISRDRYKKIKDHKYRPIASRPIARPGMKPGKKPGFTPTLRPSQRPNYKPLRPSKRPKPIQPGLRPGVKPLPGHPSIKPGRKPIKKPGHYPSLRPNKKPVVKPMPGKKPGYKPGIKPNPGPSIRPGTKPEKRPGNRPEIKPVPNPTPGINPGKKPSIRPGVRPGKKPSVKPVPGKKPGYRPTIKPMPNPTPGVKPGKRPSVKPMPGKKPGYKPTLRPTTRPTTRPTRKPSVKPYPTKKPTIRPTTRPTKRPTARPTTKPSYKPARRPTTRPTTRPSSKYKPAPRPTVRPTYRPKVKPAPRPTPKAKYKPTPRATPRPTYKPTRKTYKPTPRPRPTYKPAPRPTARRTYTPPTRKSVQPTRTRSYQPTRRATPQPTRRAPSYRPAPQPRSRPTAPSNHKKRR